MALPLKRKLTPLEITLVAGEARVARSTIIAYLRSERPQKPAIVYAIETALTKLHLVETPPKKPRRGGAPVSVKRTTFLARGRDEELE